MKSNGYIGLLDNDTIIIRHPKENREIKLHRVIAMRTFQISPKSIQGITDTETAQKHKKLMQRYLDTIQKAYDSFDGLISNAMEKNDAEKVKKLATEKIKCEYELNRYRSEFTKNDKLLDNPDSLIIPKTIEIYTIGGYVESLDNLDPDNPVWVDHRARVFGNAKILDGSYVTENCLVYDNAEIVNSRIENYARIHDNCRIESSHIKDLVEIKHNAVVKNSLLENASMVFEESQIDNCILNTGALCRGKSWVTNSIIIDTAQIQGDSRVTGCVLENRSCILSGTHTDSNYNENLELETRISEGEIPRYW
jgi:NDP-sugar pyrophosphorylase family protein